MGEQRDRLRTRAQSDTMVKMTRRALAFAIALAAFASMCLVVACDATLVGGEAALASRVNVPGEIEVHRKLQQTPTNWRVGEKEAEKEKKKAEEEARKKAEEEAKKRAEEDAKKRAEEEAKKQADEAAKKKAEEEAKKRAAEDAAAAERARSKEKDKMPTSTLKEVIKEDDDMPTTVFGEVAAAVDDDDDDDDDDDERRSIGSSFDPETTSTATAAASLDFEGAFDSAPEPQPVEEEPYESYEVPEVPEETAVVREDGGVCGAGCDSCVAVEGAEECCNVKDSDCQRC